MMKKCSKILLIILCSFIFISSPKAVSLKQLKDKLKKDEANKSALIQRQKNTRNNIKRAQGDITDLEKDIAKYEAEVEETVEKIDELNESIEEKQTEIDNLLSFMQVTDGENVYLEYVFQAKTFTDFIYRSAIVEQLTNYNNELIDNMYKMIEDSKELKNDLQKKISSSEKSIQNLESKLKKYNVTLSDLETAHSDIEQLIAERKKTIANYEKIYKENGCKETVEFQTCLLIKASKGFVRPIAKGTISSEWGYRNCPVHGKELHNGIDIAVAMGTPVYAAANGRVVSITRKYKCGGNIVVILHNINGKYYRTKYMHLATINVKEKQVVDVNTVIGTSGGGGYTLKKNGGWDTCSTGAHLHFTILKGEDGSSSVNPRTFINFPALKKSFSGRI